MSSRHLIIRVREHLNFKSIQKSAVKNDIISCDSCSSVKFGLNNFSILPKCKSEFHTRMHEALLIRKSNPNLNRQLYANGTFFNPAKYFKCFLVACMNKSISCGFVFLLYPVMKYRGMTSLQPLPSIAKFITD